MITALPSPPSTNDPSNFATKADALLAALPNFVTEANATAVAMNLNSTTDTSASSVAIGTGAKSFTVSTGKSFQPGMYLVIADTAAPSTNSMYGQITSYNTGTGALVMNVLEVSGSGTKTAWVISQAAAAPVQALPGFLFGCTMSTAGSSATMSIAAGRATDSTGVQSMALTAIAKTTSAWAVGTATGGLDTGSIANSTWYHFYVIRRPDTGVVDVIFSLSASAPTLPANYTQYRYIGSGVTNGSAQWTAFVQVGDEFIYAVPLADAAANNPGTAVVLRTLSVPQRAGVQAILGGYISWTASGAALHRIFSTNETDADISTDNATHRTVTTNGVIASIGRMNIRTNSSGQINTRHTASAVGDILFLNTLGWIDTRGREA